MLGTDNPSRAASRAHARAIVESIRATGWTNGHDVEIQIRLRVLPEKGAEFVHERKQFFPPHAVPMPGDALDVEYDPADTANVALPMTGLLLLAPVVTTPDGSAARAGQRYASDNALLDTEHTVARLERLKHSLDEHALSKVEFDREKARALPTGTFASMAVADKALRTSSGVPPFHWVAPLVLACLGPAVAYTGLFFRLRRERDVRATLFVVGGLVVLVGVILGLVRIAAHLSRRAEVRLFERGVHAEGVVERVSTSPAVLNNMNIRIAVGVRVRPRSYADFVVSRKFWVPLSAVPRPGQRIDVAFDPADISRVALETNWNADTRGGRYLVVRSPAAEADLEGLARVVDQLERLRKLEDEGAIDASEFRTLKASVVSGLST